MAFELIDKFTGSANAALVGHTPNIGTAWSGATTYMYPGSDIKLTGDGYLYNNSNTVSGTSSLIISPTTLAGSTHKFYNAWKFLTNISANNQAVAIYTPGNASADNRLIWSNGTWTLSLLGAAAATQAFAMPSTGTIIITRITAIDGVSILVETSADYGQTWATLFGGAVAFTDTTHPCAPGIWYDGLNTPTTGVLIGNLRVGPSGTAPTLAVSPTTFTVSASGTLTLTGTGTSWSAGTPGSPTFTVSGGTGSGVSGQVVAGVDSATLTLNPGSATGTLTLTDPTGGTATVTVAAGGPTTGTISGPGTCTTGSPSTPFTVTLGSAAPGGGTPVALSDASAGGTFAGTNVSGGVLTIASGATVGTFTYSRSTAGTSVITPTASGITFTPTTLSITASSTPATSFALTGPSSGSVSVESSNFSVTPNGIETGTFTPTAVSGVTFTPSTLVWAGDGSTKTFTINKSSPGTVSVNGTFSNSLTPPSSLSYTFVAVSTDVTYISSLYGVPGGVTPTAVVKNAAGGTVTPTSGGSVVAQGTGAFSVSFTAPSGLYLVAWTASGTVVLDNAVAVGGGSGGATAGEVVSTLLSTTADGAVGSVGEALKASRSAAFGKLVRSGTTLKHYGTDDTTVLKTFTLDDPLTPTSRV